MEFRQKNTSAVANTAAMKYLTQNVSDPQAAKDAFNVVLERLGNCVDSYPYWHPILSIPAPLALDGRCLNSLYRGIDHTRYFVRGFVTCPYGEDEANQIIEYANGLPGLKAYKLDSPLYSDHSHPVVVEAIDIELEGDGTIRGKDAIRWFLEEQTKLAKYAEVAETWWNMRTEILGKPHGSRSSVFVSPHTGGNMKKILEALNQSGVYGPIKESSLEMISAKKREKISNNLISTAIKNYQPKDQAEVSEFSFELRGEKCKARVRDTWQDGEELSVRVQIGEINDCSLLVQGYFYPQKNIIQSLEPTGKRMIAEKFV
ncbi:hypothetical protein MKR81_27970 (plasmid) [Vibrio campbellii]|uniref:hypothetical protein n=1 Tax=Vibrio campbellii TaxID=680 RepID=UPI001F0880B1|nr:hypothetical protein [Vibrio campbellii]UMM06895.1 hypothetical protein MKR81_27970 [Vibrio campbellii]